MVGAAVSCRHKLTEAGCTSLVDSRLQDSIPWTGLVDNPLTHHGQAAGQKQQKASLQRGAAPHTLVPKILTTIIKQYQADAIVGLTREEPRPVRALQSFCNRVQQLCCKHRLQMDIINISTIFTAVALLWDKALQTRSFSRISRQLLKNWVAFVRSVFTLVPIPGNVSSRAISNIPWASAKLGVGLDPF
ncbi:hypothetical protein WJX77_005344 [Trebouxia sp. C0004]